MISEVAKRYAKALYELAKSNNSQQKVFAEIRTLKQVFESDKTIGEFINSPLIPPDQKIAALRGALTSRCSPEVTNTLVLMAEKGRLEVFGELVEAFESFSDEGHGVNRGTVRSATVLTPEERKKIEDTVTLVTKKKVILNFTEDKTLLGGLVAQVGGWTFDDSLETHLTRLSEDLNRRSH